ncbi:glycoside hydrolase family 113 [Aestuariibaculum sediminum]|uniref:Glycoside hydrolase n=1 Tax=Aestuariibaculum sediminum TaxID=2770637 RepID=A0A8J6PXQ6_9FLAO|nr:glycoside hydrolase [Aestuariibaculum sediminum]MBD0830782.1 glycoside hydrolase [Aestuariibaculum sediminum]
MRFILIGFVAFLLNSCAMTSLTMQKINGISFVAARDSIKGEHIKPVANIHANYVAIMPFGFISNLQHPQIVYNSNRQWFGETAKGVKQYIKSFKSSGMAVMIKPQLWVSRGEFTGLIKMNNEKAWRELEDSYLNFILDYARVAQEMDVAIFCIGTELETFIDYRPEYWKHVIERIRKVYSGKLTYAANWNEFNRTPFWNDLDFIGVDAYFPVSELKTPTVEDCLEGWGLYKTELKEFSERLDKPILFTEFGYRSIDFSGKEPWNYDRRLNVINLEAQVNTTQALFESFWDEPWFAGGFLWKWFHKHDDSGGKNNIMFTPQNKPAENLIKDWYSRY